MLRLAIQRFLGAIPTLLILIALSFCLIRLAPGGPFDTEKQLPPEIEANLRAAYHLDEPLYQQFGRYVLNLMQGDFGPSFQDKEFSVTERIRSGRLMTGLVQKRHCHGHPRMIAMAMRS